MTVDDLVSASTETDVLPAPAQPARPPSGGAAAALVAGGLGSTFFGVLAVLSEVSTVAHDLLTFSSAVGPLSGKSTMAALLWLPAWGLLHLKLRNREVSLTRYLRLTTALVVVGLALTFPPVYLQLAALLM